MQVCTMLSNQNLYCKSQGVHLIVVQTMKKMEKTFFGPEFLLISIATVNIR